MSQLIIVTIIITELCQVKLLAGITCKRVGIGTPVNKACSHSKMCFRESDPTRVHGYIEPVRTYSFVSIHTRVTRVVFSAVGEQ